MSDSLKEQLLKLGFNTPPREKLKPERTARTRNGAQSRTAGAKKGPPGPEEESARNRSRREEEIDLAKAYALRAQKEKNERIAAERQRQEEARQRREGKDKLTQMLQRARLNIDSADIARHFQYGGKIRRIYVTAEQLKALNAGELAVVQLAGRYHLVSAADGEEAERILPGALALSAGMAEPAADATSDDPTFSVPDDLIW